MRRDPKPPQDLPTIGDRCRVRGRDATGVLRRLNDINWASVEWDEGSHYAPLLVHLWELVKC